MPSARPSLLAGALALAALCEALNVTVPGTIYAGVATKITVGFDTWKPPYTYESNDPQPICDNPDHTECSTDGLYQHYRLYLYTQEWQDTCYLSDLIPIGSTNPTITIPTDLGPSEDDYAITAIEFNGTTMYMPDNGVATSNDFLLTGTSVQNWTVWEYNGGWVKPYPTLPCSSYGCFRACGLKYSDANGNNEPGTSAQLFACFDACPDVEADPSDTYWSWYCFSEEFCQNATAPSGATTAIATTVTGSSWASIPTTDPTNLTTTSTSVGTTTTGPAGSSTHSSAANALQQPGWSFLGLVYATWVGGMLATGLLSRLRFGG